MKDAIALTIEENLNHNYEMIDVDIAAEEILALPVKGVRVEKENCMLYCDGVIADTCNECHPKETNFLTIKEALEMLPEMIEVLTYIYDADFFQHMTLNALSTSDGGRVVKEE